jgi:hypothetical protein
MSGVRHRTCLEWTGLLGAERGGNDGVEGNTVVRFAAGGPQGQPGPLGELLL